MRAVGERGNGGKTPAAIAVEDGGAEQGCAVIDGDHCISRGGALKQRLGVICGITAAEWALNAADIIEHAGDGRCQWWGGINSKGETA